MEPGVVGEEALLTLTNFRLGPARVIQRMGGTYAFLPKPDHSMIISVTLPFETINDAIMLCSDEEVKEKSVPLLERIPEDDVVTEGELINISLPNEHLQPQSMSMLD